MKNDRLSRCLGDIDEKFIDEAADYKKKGRKRGVYYLAAALAACILIVVAAQVRPSGVAEPRPATESPGPGSIAASPDAGVYIPAVELPETQNGFAMDMIACVVYNGAVYTQGAWLEDASALLGEYLGRATGGIDEWSDESEYSVEFAGTVAGELYAVKGYDTGFRICCLNDDGSALLLERLNGITLDTGADFDKKLGADTSRIFPVDLHIPQSHHPGLHNRGYRCDRTLPGQQHHRHHTCGQHHCHNEPVPPFSVVGHCHLHHRCGDKRDHHRSDALEYPDYHRIVLIAGKHDCYQQYDKEWRQYAADCRYDAPFDAFETIADKNGNVYGEQPGRALG